MSLRRTLAKLLDPEIFKESDQLDRIRSNLGLGRRWLGGEFPDIKAFSEWAEDNPASGWYGPIDQFREQLRRRRSAISQASEAGE